MSKRRHVVDDRLLTKSLGSTSHGGVGTVAERLAKANQERTAKGAFALRLTAVPKRRK